MTDSMTLTQTKFIFPAKSNQRRRKTVNTVMLTVTGLLTLIAIIPLFWIIAYVIIQGGKYINLDFFIHLPRPMGMQGGGVLHAIEGTILLTILAAIFSIPPGLLIAFYVSRNPNTPLGIIARFGTDVLSGIPSIVIGLFTYTLVVKTQGHYSALAGGIALAILMLPSIIRTTEEMLKLVPHTLREASLGLGAPEWRTNLQVLLPTAGNGIITGFLLGLARASGETAPLLFTALGNEHFEVVTTIKNGLNAGHSLPSILLTILNSPVDSLPLTLYKYSQLPYPERVAQSWAAALVLMAFVLIINIFSRVFISLKSSRSKR